MDNSTKEHDKISRAKNTLRKETFSPQPIAVCSHLSEDTIKNLKSKPRFIATQIYDDSYSVFWCCENCSTNYMVPEPGVFIALEDYCSPDINKLLALKRSNDEDANPYHELLEEESGNFIARSKFENNVSPITESDVLKAKYRIPFGTSISSIL